MATKVTQKHTKNNLSWHVIHIIPASIDEIEVCLFVYNSAIKLILWKNIIIVYCYIVDVIEEDKYCLLQFKSHKHLYVKF